MYIQIAVANDLRFKCRAPINYAVLLLARLMGRYCFSRCRLSSSVVCNTAGGRSGRPPGARAVPRPILHGGGQSCYVPLGQQFVLTHVIVAVVLCLVDCN